MFLYLTSNLTFIDDIKQWIHTKGLSAFDIVFKLVICLIIYYLLSKILKKIAIKLQKKLDNKNIDQIASHFVINLFRYSILVLYLFTMITQMKLVDVASIAALIASAGVGISLAMQGALSNFAGGVLLLILRPFRRGDYIILKSSDIEGVVEEIEIYYTTIKTIYGETIKIPNSQLTNNSVINKHGDDTRALIINIEVSYNTNIIKAKEIIKEIFDNEEKTDNTKTSVFVEDTEHSGIKLGGFTMVPVVDYLTIKRSITEKIILAFRENNIEIPYNQLDVHLIK